MTGDIEYYDEYYGDGEEYVVGSVSFYLTSTPTVFKCYTPDKEEVKDLLVHNVRHAIAILQNWVDDQEKPQ